MITLFPGINYNGSGITFQGTSIVLDALGNSNAQFFITSTSDISFNNVPTINLLNGATNCNVFWLAATAIRFIGTAPTSIPGIFIGGSQVTFAVASQTFGRIFAQTANVTFSGISSVNGTCGVFIINGTVFGLPTAGICFLGNTPVQTDQGSILIKNIDSDIHTINKKRIVAITKTKNFHEYLVCFDKNSLDDDYPNKRTVMSKNHKISYNGKMIEAYKFVDKFENVFKIRYGGEVLYNVLMDKHEIVKVNNLLCETLHPENIVAKLYKNGFSNENLQVLEKMNNSINKKDYPKYLQSVKQLKF